MRKRVLSLSFIILLMTLIIMPAEKAAAAAGVKVFLPSFKVSINGVEVENSFNKYPLIVYNDITYFPMTYYDCRFMGLESLWESNTGLEIVKTGVNWDYHTYQASLKNSNAYSAQAAPFKITVNGEKIDNGNEKYPLLLFRNITYFPLTWRFAVDEFGWKYSFDANNGLVINSYPGSISVREEILPIVHREIGGKGAFTMAGDYYYYEGANGKIYQAPVSNPSDSRFVYQLPQSDMGSGYVLSSLYTDNDQSILKYRTGGATMGSDHLIWIGEDGNAQEIDSGNSALKIYDEYTVRVDQWFPPATNNLQIKKNDGSGYIKVGDPENTYGLYISDTAKSRSARRNDDLYLIDDEIYILGYTGYHDINQSSDTTGIYRVNIKTSETVRICPEEAETFKIVNDIIYFIGRNKHLYQVPISGGNAELLVDKAIDLYEIVQDKIYYSLVEDQQLRTIGKDDIFNQGGHLSKLEIHDRYLIAFFDKDVESPYKMMAIDHEGRVIFKTIENVELVSIQNGEIIFIKNN